MVLGEFPMFRVLCLGGRPVNVKEATKKKKSVGKPIELGSYRILGGLQDNNKHRTVNGGNPDRGDSETES